MINNDKDTIYINSYNNSSTSMTMINNIIMGENAEVGIYEKGDNANIITLSNNCFYGIQNDHFYYDEDTGTYITDQEGLNSMSDVASGGNIVADPLMEPDNIHLQAVSSCVASCINKGIDPNGYISSLTNDIDGDKRPYPVEGKYDIGADEVTNIVAAIVGTHVAETGDDIIGVGSKINPFRTIQRGIKAAISLCSNNVYISEGIYPEHVVMENGVSILGGYSLDFNSRDTNLINYRTKIDGTGDGRCVFAKNITDDTRIEGLIISNGYLTGAMNDGAGIHCTNSSSNLIIKNNEIKNNTSLNSYGGGIYLWYSSPGIYNNNINNNYAVYGGGIYLSSSSSIINDNRIIYNEGIDGSGIYMYSSQVEINNNMINDNTGSGLFAHSSSSNIYNNIINNNLPRGI